MCCDKTHCLINATSLLMTHLCFQCPTVLFLHDSPHPYHHIIDTAFNLLTCTTKEMIKLRLLVPSSPKVPFSLVLFAFGCAVVELTMLCVQSSVNLITQTPHGAMGRSAARLAHHQPHCYSDFVQTAK